MGCYLSIAKTAEYLRRAAPPSFSQTGSIFERLLILDRFRLVFGRALGLDPVRLEGAVAGQAGIGQSRGAVLERVGQRIDAAIDDVQPARILLEREANLAATADNGAGDDVAADAQPLAFGAIAHRVELADGLVVGLTFADAAQRQPDEDAHDGDHQDGELRVRAHGFS